jgi:hypothetical protein
MGGDHAGSDPGPLQALWVLPWLFSVFRLLEAQRAQTQYLSKKFGIQSLTNFVLNRTKDPTKPIDSGGIHV